MSSLSVGQIAAFARHLLTFVMGMVTIAATMHWVTPDQASTISHSLSGLGKAGGEAVTALAPLIAIASGLYASWQASHAQKVATLQTALSDGNIHGLIVSGTPQPGPGLGFPPAKPSENEHV